MIARTALALLAFVSGSTPVLAACGAPSPSGAQPSGATDAGDGGGAPDDAGACQLCDEVTGLCSPIVACSPASPCPADAGGVQELKVPTCSGNSVSDGPPRTWTDLVNGEQRAACLFVPPGASTENKLPLVVFLHGSGGSADDVYTRTLLRAKATIESLTSTGAEGYISRRIRGARSPIRTATSARLRGTIPTFARSPRRIRTFATSTASSTNSSPEATSTRNGFTSWHGPTG